MKSIVALIAALSLIVLAACHRSAMEPARRDVPANEVLVTPKQITDSGITTASVMERPLGNTLTTTGRVTFCDTRVAHVFSPVSGRVETLFAGLGDRVRRGAALASIDSPDVGSAVSDTEKAEADLAAAQRDYVRQKELYEAHAAAARDFEAADAAYRKAKSERDRAAEKTRLFGAATGASTQKYILRAPIDGQVIARSVNPGMEVQGQYSGGTAAELFVIGNLDPIWVFADVPEAELPRVKIGALTGVSLIGYPDRSFAGMVDWISAGLDPATRTARVRCTIANRDGLLRPEMFATVAIAAADAHEKLTIPRTAVVRVADETVTFVDRGIAPTGERRFERRIVSVDEAEAGNYIAVIRGLVPGEKVVTSAAILLSGTAE